MALYDSTETSEEDDVDIEIPASSKRRKLYEAQGTPCAPLGKRVRYVKEEEGEGVKCKTVQRRGAIGRSDTSRRLGDEKLHAPSMALRKQERAESAIQPRRASAAHARKVSLASWSSDNIPSAVAHVPLRITARLERKTSAYRSADLIEADFYLCRRGKRTTKIGYLVAHLVDYYTPDHESPQGVGLWVRELLTPQPHERTTEVQNIMRLMFGRHGNTTTAFRPYAQHLDREDNILFIDTFYLNPHFRGTGLPQDCIQAFFDALEGNKWYKGVVVLSPAADATEKRRLSMCGMKTNEIGVERALIRSWEKSGFRVWKKGREDVEGSVSVMGRLWPGK